MRQIKNHFIGLPPFSHVCHCAISERHAVHDIPFNASKFGRFRLGRADPCHTPTNGCAVTKANRRGYGAVASKLMRPGVAKCRDEWKVCLLPTGVLRLRRYRLGWAREGNIRIVFLSWWLGWVLRWEQKTRTLGSRIESAAVKGREIETPKPSAAPRTDLAKADHR